MTNKLKNVGIIETREPFLKIYYYFYSFPNKQIGLNELVSHLKISKTTANKVITSLVKQGMLKNEVIGKSWRISTTTISTTKKTSKIAFNLSMIAHSNIIEEVKAKIKSYRAIILFGSYRKGDDTEKSDIDIAVEVIDGKGLRIENLGVVEKFGFRKNVKVNLYIFSKEKIDINLYSNISNGIVLEGFLEVKK